MWSRRARKRATSSGRRPREEAAMSELKLPEINRLMISGRLTRDPDKRFAQDGTPVTTFDLAFHRRFRNRDGSLGEQTGYVTVLTYQRLAEVCGEYLRKG